MKNTTFTISKRPPLEIPLSQLTNGCGFTSHGVAYLLPADASPKPDEHRVRVVEFLPGQPARIALMNRDDLVRPCDLDLVFSE